MWSFTGISSDGYNALTRAFCACRQAALWGLLLGVDRADLRLWQGHSRTSARLCSATLTYWTLRVVRSDSRDQDAGVEHLARCPALAAAPADGVLHLSGDNTRSQRSAVRAR